MVAALGTRRTAAAATHGTRAAPRDDGHLSAKRALL
jgi:hypothetical protein